MADMRSRWDHYYKRAKDVYEKEGINSFLRKGWSFSFLLINKQFWKIRHNSKASILNHDWDNLLIFDACRYDDFCEIAPYDQDRINARRTVSSNTKQFLKKTFSEEQLHDTVYITANPQFFKHWDDLNEPNVVFHDTVSVIDEWDADLGTVTPESVVEHARECHAKYPNKRLLIHFNQPHYPFIGPKGDEIRNQIDYASYGSDDTEARIWEHLAASRIDTELVQAAYEENLRLALPAVERLVSHMTGKIVVTSDHGNIFGEQVCWLPLKIYGHPPNVPAPNLTAVPWVELPWEERRNSEETETESPDTSIDQDVQQKLEDLGYV
jgi:hypothetical protein